MSSIQSQINDINRRLRNLCCQIRSNCDIVDVCLGVSPDGDPTLFLNQQGDWVSAGGSSDGWLLVGNTGTDPATNFLGTTDNQPLIFKTNNVIAGRISVNGFTDRNTSIGANTLSDVTLSGIFDTALGFSALKNNTSGSSNVSVGANSMISNLDGSENVAVGSGSLSTNDSGNQNVSIGAASGGTITSGSNNITIGYQADVATNATTNAISLGSGAIATSNEFAINPNVNSVNFSNAGIRLEVGVIGFNVGTIVVDKSRYHLVFSTSTGTPTVDISGMENFQIIVVSDLDGISAANNITINAGVGNTIRSQAGAAQTLILNQNGGSYSIQRITSTQFMVF